MTREATEVTKAQVSIKEEQRPQAKEEQRQPRGKHLKEEERAKVVPREDVGIVVVITIKVIVPGRDQSVNWINNNPKSYHHLTHKGPITHNPNQLIPMGPPIHTQH